MNGCPAGSSTSWYYLHRCWFMKNKIIAFWFKLWSTSGTAIQGKRFGMPQSLHHSIDLCVFGNQLPLVEQQVPSAVQVYLTSKFYWGYYKGAHLQKTNPELLSSTSNLVAFCCGVFFVWFFGLFIRLFLTRKKQRALPKEKINKTEMKWWQHKMLENQI